MDGNDDFAIAAMGGKRRTPKDLADELAQMDSFDRPSRQTRQRRLRDEGMDQMRRLMLLDGPEAGMSDSRGSRKNRGLEFMLRPDEGRVYYRFADGDFKDIMEPDENGFTLIDEMNELGYNDRGDLVIRVAGRDSVLFSKEQFDSRDGNPIFTFENPDRDEVVFDREFTFPPGFDDIDEIDYVGYDNMGNLVNRGPDGDQIIFTAEQLGSTGMTDDDIVDGEIVDDGQAGMAGARRTREESAELGRKIWLARTHDKISLEDAGSRFGMSRQDARQLELLHQKYLRGLGAEHPNRVGRSMLDDPMTGLTDAEMDLLRRRFDGEKIEEAAERLRTDKFAVRRMEQLALAKLRNRMLDDGQGVSAGMGKRNGGRAVEADPPKARRVERPGSQRKKNRLNPSFIQILDSLRESGPGGLSSGEQVRLAALMRLRGVVGKKIDDMMARGSGSRRMSNLGPEINELNASIRGPFSSLAEATRLSVGTPRDLVSTAIKMVNGDHDPRDLDSSINVQVFEALHLSGGDVASVARSLGMDEQVVRIRANAHSMRLLAASLPSRLKLSRRIEENGDKLTSAEQAMLRMWVDGASNLDIADKMGSGLDEKGVIAERAEALRKIGVDLNSAELRNKIVDGRIFYDEHGLFSEVRDELGNTTYNRIGDGPSAGMGAGRKTVVSADFGDGRRDYAISRTVARDRARGEESVLLVPIRGDDEPTISTLIGRQLLFDERGAGLELPAVISRSGGRVARVSDAYGQDVPFFGETTIDDSMKPSDGALSIAERIAAVRSNDSAARMKMDQDVDGAQTRYANLVTALDHLITTGDWIGGDLGVTGRVPEYATMMTYGLDADEDGRPIIPANATREQFELREAEWFLSRNPGATNEQVESHVSSASRDRIAQINRKLDLAGKELARLRHMRDSKEVRRAQNVVDLETLDDDAAQMLSDETVFLSSMSGVEFDASAVAKGADGFVYVVHKGPDRLAGGVLDPRRSAGAPGGAGDVAGQGDTRGLNRIYLDRFLQTAESNREMVGHAEGLAARIARGDMVVTAHPLILSALRGRSSVLASAFNESGGLNLANYDKARVDAIVREIVGFVDDLKRDMQRYGKIRDSLVRFGGPNMDQMLSVEADAIRATSSLNFYGRYAEADLPDDVVEFATGFTDGLTRGWDPIDPEMFDRWNLGGSLRGGAFLAVGREDSEIVRGGLLGPTSESQIISPLKPLIGVSTPVRVDYKTSPNDPKFLVTQIGPAIMARAIKMHKRDGEVDIETVLTDPSLAPEGFAARRAGSAVDDASAGMASADRMVREIVNAMDEYERIAFSDYERDDQYPSPPTNGEFVRFARYFEGVVATELGLPETNPTLLSFRSEFRDRVKSVEARVDRILDKQGKREVIKTTIKILGLALDLKIRGVDALDMAGGKGGSKGTLELHWMILDAGAYKIFNAYGQKALVDFLNAAVRAKLLPRKSADRIINRVLGGESENRPGATSLADETAALTATSMSPRASDLVARARKYLPDGDGNYAVPESVFPKKDQDAMSVAVRKILAGEELTEAGDQLGELLKRAENASAIRLYGNELPHDSDPIGTRVYGVTSGHKEVGYGQLIPFVKPGATTYRYDDGTGSVVDYIPVRIGRSLADADSFAYHPASELRYARVLRNRQLRTWNHPSNSDSGSNGTVLNWENSGVEFDALGEEIRFQASRTKQLDDKLGFTGDSPRKVIFALRRASGAKTNLPGDELRYDPYGYVIPRDATSSSGDPVLTLRRRDDFAALQELVETARRKKTGLSVDALVGYKPGTKTGPAVVNRVVYSPRIANGEIDEVSRAFVPGGENAPHLLGSDESGSPMAFEISDLLHDQFSARRAEGDLLERQRRAQRGARVSADGAEAGMSSSLDRYVRSVPARGEDGESEYEDLAIVDLPSTSSARLGGDFDESPAGVVAKIVAMVRRREADTGERNGLVFSYPSTVKGEPGVKRDKDRTLFNPMVVYGEFDPESKETRILVTDERGITRLVPISSVDLAALADDEQRRGDPSRNEDVQVGTWNVYVVGDEYVGGKKTTKTFNAARIKPAIAHGVTRPAPDGDFVVDDELGVGYFETEPATDAPRTATRTKPSTQQRPDAPTSVAPSDTDDDEVLRHMTVPEEVFDERTLLPRDPDSLFDKTRPTAYEVAKGLAMNDPKAIDARQTDERRYWEKIVANLGKWLRAWSAQNNVVTEMKNGEEVTKINPETGKPLYRTPYKKNYRWFGNPIGPDGSEMPDGVRSELEKVKDFAGLKNWMNGKKVVFFDFETTGMVDGELGSTGAPLQASFLIIENGDLDKPRGLTLAINPGDTPVTQWSIDNVKINGTPVLEALKDSPESFLSPEEARQKIVEFLGQDAVLVAHNLVNFDVKVWKDLMGDHPYRGWIDSLAVANWLFEIDAARFKEIMSLSRRTGNRDRDLYPFTDWMSSQVRIKPRKPGEKAWRGNKKPGPLQKLYRRATGPLHYKVAANEKGQLYPRAYASNKLEALAYYFGITQKDAHDAKEDTRTLARMFMEMLDLGERWGAARQMFDTGTVATVARQIDEQYSADVESWARASGVKNPRRETLFDFDARPGSGRGDTPPRSGGAGSGGGRPPGGGGGTPPRGGSFSGGDPDRRLLYQTADGVAVYETNTGIHFEIKSISPSDGREEAVVFLRALSQARVEGYAAEFNYGEKPDGSVASYRIASIEVLRKPDLTDEQIRGAGPEAYEVHGIDLSDGKLKKFELAQINSGAKAGPKPSDLTELPVNIFGAVFSDGSGGKPKTPQQYADSIRRQAFSMGRSSDGPMAGMSGLTNGDGATNSTSYWVTTQDDVAMADMSDSDISKRLASDRTRFENLFHAGPESDAAASRVLDSMAAANRMIKVRSNQTTDQNGFSVAMTRNGYKLTGKFKPPPGVMDGSYELPADFGPRRAEMARNASLSVALDYATANGLRAEAIDRVSRFSLVPRAELLGRLASHDYPTYSSALTFRKFRDASESISEGIASPSSLGMIIDPVSDLASAARAVDSALRKLGANPLDESRVLRRGGRNYAQIDQDELLNEFNESVSDLFSFDHRAMFSDPEFRVKYDAIRDGLTDIGDELRRRYLSSLADGPSAGMSAGPSPFGEADGLPILSGSKWFDARLFAVHGARDYENVATEFGNRFRTLPDRTWDNPTDDDLTDIYHFATMLNHDAMIEDLVLRGENTDSTDFSRLDVVDNGLIGVVSKISAFTGLPPARVNDLVARGRDTAFIRRLAAMDAAGRTEQMNAVRRRRAFARLARLKKKELGDSFPLWLAEASIRQGSDDRRTGGFENDFAEIMDYPRKNFYGEDVSSALDGVASFLGVAPRGQGADPSAGMAGRRPFVRQRYDIKPVDGGFVIIDTDNRNSIASRVFKDRREALRGAARMDKGDRTFDPFAAPFTPPPPKNAPESIVRDPKTEKLAQPKIQPTLFDDNGDPNVGMSATGMPSKLRFASRSLKDQGVSEENVRSAMSEYDSGRASLPYPSPDDVPVSRLMGGYASSDAALNTVMGRIEQIAGDRSNREEMQRLASNLEKLQKRRNYFYNQLRERLDDGDPDMQTLESWHSQRAGLDRESTTRFGLGNLPAYIMPSKFVSDAPASDSTPGYVNGSSDFALLETIGNLAAENLSSNSRTPGYSARRRIDEIIKSVQRDVERISRRRGESMAKFGQKAVRIGAQVLAMAARAGKPDGEALRRELISAGLSQMVADGGSRLGLAYLVNAVDAGILTSLEAKRMLRKARGEGLRPTYEMTKAEGLLARGQMSRLVSELFGTTVSTKSAGRNPETRRLSIITETISSVLTE